MTMAEGVGFEPTVALRLRLISSQVPLTTQPPFRASRAEDALRCVPSKHIVRVFASGASSFATPANGGRDSRADACRIGLPFTLTLPK